LSAYQQAVKDGYRFYSYGDAMLLEKEAAPPESGRT
jgi:S-adenosylmethionine:tRNA-ribosyltransferase-isomerase (queuine synthetase)